MKTCDFSHAKYIQIIARKLLLVQFYVKNYILCLQMCEMLFVSIRIEIGWRQAPSLA